ncbi:hypothetical protein H5410_003469 [Solanum commersonii]|uniref:Uncharacterized protein n=1 Tax=Solanum commersonii TaxID=4109 RepID=A0A9J6B546_SOLCO|nr:hypothetical protein H5410_003469 [Solanum commersonii]
MEEGNSYGLKMLFMWTKCWAVNHLFLYCKMTSQIWDLLTSLRGIRCTMPGRTSEALTSWTTEGESSTHKDRRRNVLVTIRWTIWKERNSRNSRPSKMAANTKLSFLKRKYLSLGKRLVMIKSTRFITHLYHVVVPFSISSGA